MITTAEYEELQKLCRRSFPGRLDQGISQIETVQSGRHPAMSFSLSWREGRRPRVERLLVRRYADPWTWWSAEDTDKADREWTVMRWLYAEGFPVPALYASGTQDQDPFLLMARVPGRRCSLERPAEVGAYVEACANLLARLHRLTPPSAVREALPATSVGRELNRLDELARQCAADETVSALAELRAQEVEELPPCVLHGDPRADHVLCDARGVTALLGWESAALGDPRWDIARVATQLRGRGADPLVDEFLAAYQAAGGPAPGLLAYWEALTAMQGWTLVEWADRTAAPECTAGLMAMRDEMRATAWRAMTRLRYIRERDLENGEQPLAETHQGENDA